jgi:hypothetical protein
MIWFYITVVCLGILFVLVVAGLFSDAFQDNWLQHIGLIGMGITSVSALFRISSMAWVSQEMAVFILALTLFGLGTAHKVWKFRSVNKSRSVHATDA